MRSPRARRRSAARRRVSGPRSRAGPLLGSPPDEPLGSRQGRDEACPDSPGRRALELLDNPLALSAGALDLEASRADGCLRTDRVLSLIHISEPTRLGM